MSMQMNSFLKLQRNAGRELLFSDGSHAFSQKDHASGGPYIRGINL